MTIQEIVNAPSKCRTCGYEWKTGTDGRHSCIDRLNAKVAELEKDKERLDWVEKQSNGSYWVARNSHIGRGYRLHNTTVANEIQTNAARMTAREAIDAAMNPNKKE
jgi:hypothetical protein